MQARVRTSAKLHGDMGLWEGVLLTGQSGQVVWRCKWVEHRHSNRIDAEFCALDFLNDEALEA